MTYPSTRRGEHPRPQPGVAKIRIQADEETAAWLTRLIKGHAEVDLVDGPHRYRDGDRTYLIVRRADLTR